MTVKASGKNTRSTFLAPRNDLSSTGWPCWSLSVKSGASVPTPNISFCTSRKRSSLVPSGGLRLRLDEPAGDPVAELRGRRLHKPCGGRRLGVVRELAVPWLPRVGRDHR